MIRVLVMASDSLLADAIVSNLAQDASLEVRRLRQHDPGPLSQTAHEDFSVVILVEETASTRISITASDLLRKHRCIRIITISAQNHNLQICDGYEIPVSGMRQVLDLAKSFDREKLNEVTE